MTAAALVLGIGCQNLIPAVDGPYVDPGQRVSRADSREVRAFLQAHADIGASFSVRSMCYILYHISGVAVNEFIVDVRDKSDPKRQRGRMLTVLRTKEGWKIEGWLRSFCGVELWDDRITFEDAAEIIDAMRRCRTIRWRGTHSEDEFHERGGAARRIKREYMIDHIDICGPQTTADDRGSLPLVEQGLTAPPPSTEKSHLDFHGVFMVEEGDYYVETWRRGGGPYTTQCIFLARIAGVMTVVAVYNSFSVG